MKQIVLLLTVLAATVVASPLTTACPPDFINDGHTVPTSCSGLGATPVAIPSTHWLIAFNDDGRPPSGDGDTNDLWFTMAVDAVGSSALLTYGGDLTSYTDVLSFFGVSFFNSVFSNPGDTYTIAVAPNIPLTFTLTSYSSFHGVQTFTTGTEAAFVVCQDCGGSQVPEPRTLLLGGLGLLALGFFKR